MAVKRGLQNVTSWILPNLLSITLQITICIHSNTNSLPLKHKFASYRKTICNTTRSELWYWLISDEIHSGGISCFKTNIYLLLNYLQFGGCPTEGIVDPLLYIAFFENSQKCLSSVYLTLKVFTTGFGLTLIG